MGQAFCACWAREGFRACRVMLWPFFEKFWAAAGPRPFEEPVMKIRDILQSCE